MPKKGKLRPGYVRVDVEIPRALKRDLMKAKSIEHVSSMNQFIINAIRDRIRKRIPDAPSLTGNPFEIADDEK